MTETLPLSPPASNASVSSVAVLDPDGTIVAVNGTWAEIASEAGARAAVGANYLDICEGVSGADRPDAEAMSSAIVAVSSGACECRTLEYSCVVPGLGRHTFSARVLAIGTGSPRRVVVIHDDVTEARLVAEHELVQSRMLESLLGAIEDFGIFTLDTAGRVKSWNSGARALLGYERNEVIDRHFEAFFEPADRADGLPSRELEEALKGPVRVERPHVRKDGTRFVAFSTIYALRDARGRPAGFAKIMGDCSQLRRIESALGRAVEALQLRNDELEQFVYSVSHDLKTPLVTIAGFAGHAASDVAAGRTERLDGFIQRISGASRRMGDTLDDLLRLSRVGRGPAGDSQPPALRTSEFISQVIGELRDQVGAAGATGLVDPQIPDVAVEPTVFRELVENLLGNALKHGCPAPGMRIEITARPATEHGQARVLLVVRDYGPGIPEESRRRVFGLFQRLSNATAGTGVGLAIVKRIAQVGGGEAWFESPPAGETGAVAVVSLPAAMDRLVVVPRAGTPEPVQSLPQRPTA